MADKVPKVEEEEKEVDTTGSQAGADDAVTGTGTSGFGGFGGKL